MWHTAPGRNQCTDWYSDFQGKSLKRPGELLSTFSLCFHLMYCLKVLTSNGGIQCTDWYSDFEGKSLKRPGEPLSTFPLCFHLMSCLKVWISNIGSLEKVTAHHRGSH